MAFGSIDDRQKAALREYVEGRHVVDACAGDLTYAKILRDLGARSVRAFDKELPRRVPKGVQFRHSTAFDFAAELEQKHFKILLQDRSFSGRKDCFPESEVTIVVQGRTTRKCQGNRLSAPQGNCP